MRSTPTRDESISLVVRRTRLGHADAHAGALAAADEDAGPR